jgi:hypothetical protein
MNDERVFKAVAKGPDQTMVGGCKEQFVRARNALLAVSTMEVKERGFTPATDSMV